MADAIRLSFPWSCINLNTKRDMHPLEVYRRMHRYPAAVFAALLSFGAAASAGALGAAALGLVLERGDVSGPGAGVLLICTVYNLANPVFVLTLSFLVNCHDPTSWRTPTLAFAVCATLTWLWIPFPVALAPVVLGTGAVAWIFSCWMLRRKGSSRSQDAIET